MSVNPQTKTQPLDGIFTHGFMIKNLEEAQISTATRWINNPRHPHVSNRFFLKAGSIVIKTLIAPGSSPK